MALEEAKDGDARATANGFNFAVDGDLVDIYGQFTVDYSDNWLRRGFVVYPEGSSPDGGC